MQRFLWTALAAGITLMAPLVTRADDQSTAEEIANNFNGRLKGYSVQVKVQDGVAWLNGCVADSRQMSTAVAIAKQNKGVKEVVNNLAIGPVPNQPAGAAGRPSPKQYADDDGSQLRPIPSQGRQQMMPISDEDSDDGSYNRTASAQMYQGPNPRAAGYAPNGYGPNAQSMPNTMRQGGQPMPLPISANGGPYRQASAMNNGEMMGGPQPMPDGMPMGPGGPAPYRYDHANMPGYAWPSYAAYPNYAAVTYPKQYSPTAWPYIGPFYPYPQVPLGWRKVALEWKDGWWMLDFQDSHN